MIPPHAGRDRRLPSLQVSRCISIHPPLAGRDLSEASIRPPTRDFNPPAPCGAGPCSPCPRATDAYFNPPAPCGAGRATSTTTSSATDFNPPAPCGAGLSRPVAALFYLRISIHPPLAGRDSDLAQKNCAKHRILHKKCIYPGRIERFSGFDAAIFLPNVHKFRCEPSEESLLAPRSHAYTIRTPSG